VVLLVLASLSKVVGYQTVYVSDNHPPNAPVIRGRTYTRPGTYIWKFKAIDPDGDNIFYEIDWGDGVVEKWIGPFASGAEVAFSHSYYTKGTAQIKARANDTHGAIGDWGYLHVVISKSTQIINLPFLHLLERFPHAFPILRFFLFLFLSPAELPVVVQDGKVTSILNKGINREIKPLDNGYFEIVTSIDGYCEDVDCKGIFIKRHMEIWVSGSGLNIEAHTLNPSCPIYYAKPSYFYAPVFIGWMWMVSVDCYTIHGKAYGNIYWE
jgi:hypothetical protein